MIYLYIYMYVKHTIGKHINNRNLNEQIKLCVFVEDIVLTFLKFQEMMVFRNQ